MWGAPRSHPHSRIPASHCASARKEGRIRFAKHRRSVSRKSRLGRCNFPTAGVSTEKATHAEWRGRITNFGLTGARASLACQSTFARRVACHPKLSILGRRQPTFARRAFEGELRWAPFARIRERRVEAPPGFEPGVEVLQGHPRSLLSINRLPISRASCCASNTSCFSGDRLKLCPVG